jgi:hypothetical protein
MDIRQPKPRASCFSAVGDDEERRHRSGRRRLRQPHRGALNIARTMISGTPWLGPVLSRSPGSWTNNRPRLIAAGMSHVEAIEQVSHETETLWPARSWDIESIRCEVLRARRDQLRDQ